MIYGTFSRLNVAKGVERWGKGLIYLKLLWGIDSSCSNDRPFLWVKSAVYISCHLQLLAAYCCFSQRGYQKHGVTRGALLDITVIGCTLADSAGELADFSIYFPFSQDEAQCAGQRGLFRTKENRVVWERGRERKFLQYKRFFKCVIYHSVCCWPWVEWAVSKRTRAECVKISRCVGGFVLFLFSSCVFIACGDADFHPQGHIQAWDNAT